LYPQDNIVLYQQMRSGETTSRFDQRANYSFASHVEYAAWLNVAVFHKDQLLWGREPATANPEACFALAVNVNGQAVNVDGRVWQGASEAGVTTTGSGANQSDGFVPSASEDLAKVLTSFTKLEAGKLLELPLPNATYLVYLNVVSPPNAMDSGTLLIEGVKPDQSAAFLAQEVDMARAWGRLGPYRTQLTDGKLTVGVGEGAVYLAGIEVFYPD
jgi:hypothetical protein